MTSDNAIPTVDNASGSHPEYSCGATAWLHGTETRVSGPLIVQCPTVHCHHTDEYTVTATYMAKADTPGWVVTARGPNAMLAAEYATATARTLADKLSRPTH